MTNVVIVSAKRTPIGRMNGSLKSISEATLSALTMKAITTSLEDKEYQIDEVIIGNSKQTSLPSNLARYAMLEADLPEEIPAYTVQRQAASGLQAISSGYMAIKSGTHKTILAGGTESMSQIPVEIQNARFEFIQETDIIFDAIQRQVTDAQPEEITEQKKIEEITAKYKISEQEINDFLVATAAKESAPAEENIVPLEIKVKKNIVTISEDETGDIAQLAPYGDAAASVLMMDEKTAKQKDFTPTAKILGVTSSAGDPIDNMIDIRSIQRLLKKNNLKMIDIDCIHIAETSAAYVLAMKKALESEFDLNLNNVLNPFAGGLKTANSWGASGVIQLIDSLNYVKENQGKYGLIVTPVDGGQTMSLLFEAR